jgi:hypothetical protein
MKINKLSLVLVFFLSLTLFSCNDDETVVIPSNYVSFDAKQKKISLLDNEETVKDINIYTNDISGADRTFMVELIPVPVTVPVTPTLAAENYTLPATVVVPANSNKGVIKMGLKNVSLSFIAQFLHLSLKQAPGISVGKPLLISFTELCPLNSVTLNLKLDAYGSETKWTLYNSSLEVLFTGGPYTDGVTGPIIQNWCLPNGEYTFLIEDSYGDGIAPAGSYKITRSLNGSTQTLAQGGAFAQFDTKVFILD